MIEERLNSSSFDSRLSDIENEKLKDNIDENYQLITYFDDYEDYKDYENERDEEDEVNLSKNEEIFENEFLVNL